MDNNCLTIKTTKLYKYNFYHDELCIFTIKKVTKKRIYFNEELDWGNHSISINEVGMQYFLNKEQALKFGIMREAADDWISLVNKLDWSENIKERCDKEGINWRTFMR